MSCKTIILRIVGPIGGKWIPYTAAQVAARRAAQMVVVTVCAAAPLPAAAPAPAAGHAPHRAPPALAAVPAHLLSPLSLSGPVLELVPDRAPAPRVERLNIPEPPTALLFAGAVALLVVVRRGMA